MKNKQTVNDISPACPSACGDNNYVDLSLCNCCIETIN